jgi:hypothetical protein
MCFTSQLPEFFYSVDCVLSISITPNKISNIITTINLFLPTFWTSNYIIYFKINARHFIITQFTIKSYHYLLTFQSVHIGKRSGSVSLYQRSMFCSQSVQNVNWSSPIIEIAGTNGLCSLHIVFSVVILTTFLRLYFNLLYLEV